MATATYFEPPQEYHGLAPSLFLAGGITQCPDWQATCVTKLTQSCPKLVLLNPRRKHFNVNDNSLTQQQIVWEFNHLRKATAIVFWFPCETLCPITLYELGTWSVLSKATGTQLFIGCHPQYRRKEDVAIQTRLIQPDLHVVDSLEALLSQIHVWYECGSLRVNGGRAKM
jgi:hypothetical protein